jgi:hypothetical protein
MHGQIVELSRAIRDLVTDGVMALLRRGGREANAKRVRARCQEGLRVS